MNKQVLAVILGTLVLAACNDDASEKSNQESCSGADCQDQDGLCNGKKCEADEKCVEGECKKQEQPVGEGSCNGKKCADDELCIDDKCQKHEESCEGADCGGEPEEETCGGKQCKSGEVCEDDKCVPVQETKCGDKVCKEDETCLDGECIAVSDECDPPCKENQWCDGGTCVDNEEVLELPGAEIPARIFVTPQSGLITRRSGAAAAISVVLNQPPSAAVTIPVKSLDESLGTVSPDKLAFDQENWDQIQGVVVTGTTEATGEDKTYNIQIGPAEGDSAFQALEAITIPVTHIDDVLDGDCKAGQTKDDAGKCISVAVTSIKLKNPSYDILRDQTVMLEAEVEPSNASNKELEWEFKNVTKDKLDDKIANIIGIASSKDTLSSNVTGVSKGARDVEVTITSKSNKSIKATAKLEIKPYYPLVDYDYMFTGESPRRNLNYGKIENNKIVYDEDKVKKPGSDDLSCGYFSENAVHVFNHDLYTDFVMPKMMKVDGKYYATRASVVAAARFLTMQFPLDIPYHMGREADNRSSHYSWNSTKKAAQGCEGRIFGLNLLRKAFNNYNDDVKNDKGEYLYKGCKNSKGEYVTTVWENPKDDPQAWGCKYKVKNSKGEVTKRFRVGLECTGFVTWALRNGRFNLGDWRAPFYKTSEFFKFYDRDYNGPKTDRNYQLSKYMHGNCLLSENGDCKIRGSNVNNAFDNVMKKFSKIVPEEDILDISKMTKAQQKTIKAGDILYHPKYYCKRDKDGKGNCVIVNGKKVNCDPQKEKCGSTNSGHVAMIIAINRDNDGNPKEIYVGEASRIGNQVTKFDGWDAFANGKDVIGKESSWSKTYLYPSYVVKMDHVYDYFSRINNLKDENGNPLDGNTYKYTDMWK